MHRSSPQFLDPPSGPNYVLLILILSSYPSSQWFFNIYAFFLPSAPCIWYDNVSVFVLASNPMFHPQTKPFEVDSRFLQCIVHKDLNINIISSANQLMYHFTRDISSQHCDPLKTILMVTSMPFQPNAVKYRKARYMDIPYIPCNT